MELVRESEVAVTSDDRVFCYSRWRAALVTTLVLGSAIGLFVVGRRQPPGVSRYLSYYIAAVFLLGLILLSRYITARFRQTNWLARVGATGVFIKFRSYLNYTLPQDSKTVAFIPHSEIRSARLLYDHTKFTDAQGRRATQTIRYVEFDLTADVAALAEAVATERTRPASSEAHWYGTSSTVYRHYPVQVVLPSFVQVQWSAAPGRKAFLEALRPFARIAAVASLAEDFTGLATLSREQQEQRLRELDARGQTVLAIYTARRLYGHDLAAAKAFIERLRGTEAQQEAWRTIQS